MRARKTFNPIVLKEWLPLFRSMSEHERSECLLGIVAFPDYEPKGVISWPFFKAQLENLRSTYEEKCNRNKEIALKREAARDSARTCTDVHERPPQVHESAPNKNKNKNKNNININDSSNHSSVSEKTDPDFALDSKDKNPKIPFDEIVGLYNRMCVPGCVECLRLTPARKTALRSRAVELMKFWHAETHDEIIECFRRIFERVSESDFLMGRTQRSGDHSNFRVDLSWILKAENLTKILEEKYS